ncbi:hypothetical protein [Alcanivorax xiamenensis]|uniref:hypothetical protein n=1 Tax=Alcanivorax xiamenensis TaxID=1177156 RepID=UPI001358770C|nr:hypothetical protein [Alcanivorax xiamenensis]
MEQMEKIVDSGKTKTGDFELLWEAGLQANDIAQAFGNIRLQASFPQRLKIISFFRC